MLQCQMSIIILTTRQKRYFNVAKRNAKKSTYTRFNYAKNRISIGASIVKGNYVVSNGTNKIKTHTFQHLYNTRASCVTPSPRIHAEIDALIYSRYDDLSGCEMFVYRANADGTLGNCKPCNACRSAMKDAGIKHVYYTTEDGYHYERL